MLLHRPSRKPFGFLVLQHSRNNATCIPSRIQFLPNRSFIIINNNGWSQGRSLYERAMYWFSRSSFVSDFRKHPHVFHSYLTGGTWFHKDIFFPVDTNDSKTKRVKCRYSWLPWCPRICFTGIIKSWWGKHDWTSSMVTILDWKIFPECNVKDSAIVKRSNGFRFHKRLGALQNVGKQEVRVHSNTRQAGSIPTSKASIDDRLLVRAHGEWPCLRTTYVSRATLDARKMYDYHLYPWSVSFNTKSSCSCSLVGSETNEGIAKELLLLIEASAHFESFSRNS